MTACARTESVEELARLPVDALSPLRPLLRCTSQYRTVLVAVAVALSIWPVAILVRDQIERRAFAVALNAVKMLGVWVKEPPAPPLDDGEFLPLLPPLGEASSPRLGPASSARRAPRSVLRGDRNERTAEKWVAPPILPLPEHRHVSTGQVLGWASARVMPVGRTREAGFGLPAGIELSSVAGLGIGLLDGDRLVAVGGVPVSERAQVVSLVLAARGRHEPQLVASLWRRTALGPRAFSVVVDQPYPTGLDGSDAKNRVNSPATGISGASALPASPN